MPHERLNSFSELFIKACHENAAPSKLFLNIEVLILEAKLKVCLLETKKLDWKHSSTKLFKFLV